MSMMLLTGRIILERTSVILLFILIAEVVYINHVYRTVIHNVHRIHNYEIHPLLYCRHLFVLFIFR